jgi:N-glycosylase/DNA lyase
MKSTTSVPARLHRTVRKLCPLVFDYMTTQASRSEYELRRELVACVVSSQVSYSMAANAMDNLLSVGLLDDDWWRRSYEPDFEAIVGGVLDGSCAYLPHSGSYRFPRARAQQLTRLRDSLAQRSIGSRVKYRACAKDLRQQLVSELAGVGPKQASMFLRNSGITYDLAVLDVHVIRFMASQHLIVERQTTISTLTAYESAERVAVEYARSLGYPVGIVDRAIWIVMRAAQELRL